MGGGGEADVCLALARGHNPRTPPSPLGYPSPSERGPVAWGGLHLVTALQASLLDRCAPANAVYRRGGVWGGAMLQGGVGGGGGAMLQGGVGGGGGYASRGCWGGGGGGYASRGCWGGGYASRGCWGGGGYASRGCWGGGVLGPKKLWTRFSQR